MAFDQARFDVTKAEIDSAVDSAAGIAGVVVPEYAAYITLGRIVARLAPDVYEQVAKAIEGVKPTEDEKTDLAKGILSLGSPETI